jgi:DNA-binding NarL/FixJ family response regulator
MNKKPALFSPLEARVLLDLLDGRAPRYVMDHLHLSESVFRTHISHIRSKVRRSWSPIEEKPLPPLTITPAQLRVLRLRAEGKSHGQIAYALGISICTSHIHSSQGLKRLGIDCRHGYRLGPLQQALAKLEEVK